MKSEGKGMCPIQGSNPQPVYVPGPGFKSFGLPDDAPTNCATPARAFLRMFVSKFVR